MSAAVQHICREIDQLAPDEARELFANLQRQYSLRIIVAPDDDTEDAADIEAEWDAEIDKRAQEIEDGTVKLLSADESESRTNAVFAKLGIQRPVFTP